MFSAFIYAATSEHVSFCVRIVKLQSVKSRSSSADDSNVTLTLKRDSTGHSRPATLIARKYHVGQLIGRGAFGEVRLGNSIYLSIYLKSQDYGDVGAEAQQGRLTM